VGTAEIVFGVLVVVVMTALGGYYTWRQWLTLHQLRAGAALPDDERRYLRNQAWRRLAGSVLMLLFAGLFVGMFYLEGPAAQLVAQGDEAKARNEQPELDPAQKEFVRFYGGYWIVLLLVLLGIIAVAGYEFFAIRRYSLRHMRQIQADRRAMIAAEAGRLRRDRNGHAGA
jgi:hypothetical protein